MRALLVAQRERLALYRIERGLRRGDPRFVTMFARWAACEPEPPHGPRTAWWRQGRWWAPGVASGLAALLIGLGASLGPRPLLAAGACCLAVAGVLLGRATGCVPGPREPAARRAPGRGGPAGAGWVPRAPTW